MLIILSSIAKRAMSIGYCRFKAPFCGEGITWCLYPYPSGTTSRIITVLMIFAGVALNSKKLTQLFNLQSMSIFVDHLLQIVLNNKTGPLHLEFSLMRKKNDKCFTKIENSVK